MNDYKLDTGWFQEQLDEAGYTTDRGDDFARTRETVILMALQFNASPGTAEEKLKALELFSKLAQGNELVGRNVQNPGARWTDLRLGEVKMGSTVRVRHDAYPGASGKRHNGMIGRLVAVRGGQCAVQYADSSDGTGHRHQPDKLEVLVSK